MINAISSDPGFFLIILMIYFLMGLIRTILKTAHLAQQQLITARNDDVAAFKYMLKNPTIGDVVFAPVQLFLMASIFIVLGFLKIIFFILK